MYRKPLDHYLAWFAHIPGVSGSGPGILIRGAKTLSQIHWGVALSSLLDAGGYEFDERRLVLFQGRGNKHGTLVPSELRRFSDIIGSGKIQISEWLRCPCAPPSAQDKQVQPEQPVPLAQSVEPEQPAEPLEFSVVRAFLNSPVDNAQPLVPLFTALDPQGCFLSLYGLVTLEAHRRVLGLEVTS